MKSRITAVVVLYKMQPAESLSYQTILQAQQAIGADQLDLQILLYDNTPGAVDPASLPTCVRYIADQGNSGLASAYNRALTFALIEGYDWLLTLDQDTELPRNTFSVLLASIAIAAKRPEIAAIVPQIVANGRVVSPNYFFAGVWPKWFAPGFIGVPEQTVFAFNSGTLIRTAALRQIGGYSPWFWLDNSDANLFEQLNRYGKRVYVAGSLVLTHDFSMLNMQERISPERYRTILLAESAFWDKYRNGLAGLERTMRLAGRVFKHLRRNDSAELRRLTLQQLLLRLFRSRRYRLAQWRSETAKRLGGEPLAGFVPNARPVVSVCMAAYNGERYLNAQMGSIVNQLSPGDEIVVVDDSSSDQTPELLCRWQEQLAGDNSAPNLLLIRHESNRGVIRTFEQAIRAASGDVLFLADDDDLWASEKVEKVLAVFAHEPATQLVSTGLSLIDEHGQRLLGSDFLQHRRFTTNLWSNLWHNQFQGSTMAFRSTLLRQILPMPARGLFLHDVWIGTRNTLTGGSATHLEEPLLFYRRHGGNLSGRHSRIRQIKLRIQLLWAHLWRLLSHR